ncbi:hypothetical protein GTO10_06475, partial [Candidatus Saccharibacteria bacterium]|nr:hypothetical protein [Candidatus Saccharibacteria bacterium]
TDRKNFLRFFYRLDKPYYRYKFFDELLKFKFGQSKDAYFIYRSGLVHDYFIRGKIQISTSEKLSLGSFVAQKAKGAKSVIGVGQNPVTGNLGLATSTYFRDFIKLLSEWRDKLFLGEDSRWVNTFLTSIS